MTCCLVDELGGMRYSLLWVVNLLDGDDVYMFLHQYRRPRLIRVVVCAVVGDETVLQCFGMLDYPITHAETSNNPFFLVSCVW